MVLSLARIHPERLAQERTVDIGQRCAVAAASAQMCCTWRAAWIASNNVAMGGELEVDATSLLGKKHTVDCAGLPLFGEAN